MDPREIAILEEIEAELTVSDARFAARMAAGPSPTLAYRLSLIAATAAGVFLVMLFPVNILYGIAGYLVLVGAGTSILRHRRPKSDNTSPLAVFHRLTAGLFRNTPHTDSAADGWDYAD